MAKKSWPYPVLEAEGNDYPYCAFQASVDIKQTRTEFLGEVRMDLGSETLAGALSRGDAVFALQLHCPRTSFRKIEKSFDSRFQFRLAEGTLRDDFTVQPYLVAERRWELFSDELAATFKGLRFQIEKGYVLALAPQIQFYAEKRLDDLRSVKAIFQVVRNPDITQKAVEFDFLRDRIAIFLANDDFRFYEIFRTRPPYSQMFVCSLVLPALQQALLQLKNDDQRDDLSGPRWKRVLRRCLKDCGEEDFEEERVFVVAQRLLEMPLARAFVAVNSMESESQED